MPSRTRWQPGFVAGAFQPRRSSEPWLRARARPSWLLWILSKPSGAYVPLDVNVPSARIGAILEVAQCKLALLGCGVPPLDTDPTGVDVIRVNEMLGQAPVGWSLEPAGRKGCQRALGHEPRLRRVQAGLDWQAQRCYS